MQSGVISDVYRCDPGKSYALYQGSKGQFVILGLIKVTRGEIRSPGSMGIWACKSYLPLRECFTKIEQTCADSQYLMFLSYLLRKR